MNDQHVSARTAGDGKDGVSAIVLCFNAERHIERCVRNLAESLEGFAESEIIVVENGSEDSSREILRELEKASPELLQVIYLDRNIGTTRSRNMALRRASNEYLLVIDADATIDKESLKELMQVLDEEPGCGIAVPRIKYPDGRYQISCDQFPTLWQKVRRAFLLKKMEQVVMPPIHRKDVDYAISALWLMKRSILDEVGYLDERIFYSPEDVDYCYRVRQAGLRVVYEPSAIAIHDAQELSRGFRINFFMFHHVIGLAYYFTKHRYLFNIPGRGKGCEKT